MQSHEFWVISLQDLQTLALHLGQNAPVLNTTPNVWWHRAQSLPGCWFDVSDTFTALDFLTASRSFFKSLKDNNIALLLDAVKAIVGEVKIDKTYGLNNKLTNLKY